jgi:bifunctional DNA-binding transcriptional regulator/antitoxin component of YhaV-PrlF toxin-antitoxin module
METTQLIGEDYRITVPANIRKIMGAERGDYITVDIKEIAKKGER